MTLAQPSQTTTPGTSPAGRVLQVGPLLPSLEAELHARFDVVRLPRPAERFLAVSGPEFVAAITTARVGVDANTLAALPNLGAVIHFGVGYDATDVAGARARGILVSNTPDVLTDCVADTAVGALITVMRRLTAADRFVRRGDWARGEFPLSTKVSGKRVGILGLGRIGRAVARRLEGFGCTIAYHNRSPVTDAPYAYANSLESLAAGSDVLVVAAAGGAGTRGLVSQAVLDALGPAGFLVNVARGSVVDERALVRALEEGRLAGAALDVFADEPHVPAELLGRDDVVVLPHLASATHETRAAMGRMALDNLERFLSTGEVLTPVPHPAPASTHDTTEVVL
ncbi:2-hydroxyacid dehydrogenase [Georgenia sp. AZ-5]|uniref:2-hydroxyacid dehydrogenase n=1 Tax=Georgenia sp. AZ-5 TaxID=3367526 RepID=UPI0037550705